MELAREGVDDAARVGEADLGLLRVDVHVDQVGRQLEVDDADRVAAGLEHRAVGLRDGAGEGAVLARGAR